MPIKLPKEGLCPLRNPGTESRHFRGSSAEPVFSLRCDLPASVLWPSHPRAPTSCVALDPSPAKLLDLVPPPRPESLQDAGRLPSVLLLRLIHLFGAVLAGGKVGWEEPVGQGVAVLGSLCWVNSHSPSLPTPAGEARQKAVSAGSVQGLLGVVRGWGHRASPGPPPGAPGPGGAGGCPYASCMPAAHPAGARLDPAGGLLPRP